MHPHSTMSCKKTCEEIWHPLSTIENPYLYIQHLSNVQMSDELQGQKTPYRFDIASLTFASVSEAVSFPPQQGNCCSLSTLHLTHFLECIQIPVLHLGLLVCWTMPPMCLILHKLKTQPFSCKALSQSIGGTPKTLQLVRTLELQLLEAHSPDVASLPVALAMQEHVEPWWAGVSWCPHKSHNMGVPWVQWIHTW